MQDTTPDDLFVTARREKFFDALRPGDVFLFQGADFLAGLAQLTERRTCYHSAIYLGAAPAASGDTTVEHVLAHNVSTLWWRDLAAEGDRNHGTLHPPIEAIISDGPERQAFFELLAARLVELHLANPWDETPSQLAERAFQLVTKGGVGAVSVDEYLDRCRRERLYSGEARGEGVHHVRSLVALRQERLADPDGDPTMREVLEAKIELAAEATAHDATAFNAAELLSVVPECIDRPGYPEWSQLTALAEHPSNRRLLARLFGLSKRGRPAPSARDLLRQRLRSIDPFDFFFPDESGPGWICASYVIATYEKADLDLDAGALEDVCMAGLDGEPVPLSTPRDLWDCQRLVPIALFVRGPERWRPAPAATTASTTAASRGRAPGAAATSQGAMFVDFSGGLDAAALEIAPGVAVPVVPGPTSVEEAERFTRDAVMWRYATVGADPARTRRWPGRRRPSAPLGRWIPEDPSER
jgi:hypothetical protein